jgi:hypothetical protein
MCVLKSEMLQANSIQNQIKDNHRQHQHRPKMAASGAWATVLEAGARAASPLLLAW